MNNSRMCTLCRNQAGILSCGCEGYCTFYCTKCFSDQHAVAYPQIHEAKSVLDDCKIISGANLRLVRLTIEEQLQQFDNLRRHAIYAFTSIEKAVYKAKLEVLAAITREFQEVERLVQQFERTLDRETLCGKLLSPEISTEMIKAELRSAFIYRVDKTVFMPESASEQPLQLSMLPYFDAFDPKCLSVPSCVNLAAELPLSLSEKLHPFTTAAQYNSDCIFFCGREKLKDCCKFDIRKREITHLPNSLHHRNTAGIFVTTEYVYLFGGREGERVHRYCERFSMRAKKWELITEMNYERNWFMPVALNGEVFCFGGYSSPKPEVFSLRKQAFRLLNLKLPWTGSLCATVAVESQGSFYLFQSDGKSSSVFAWRPDEQQVEKIAKISGRVSSWCPPVLVGEDVFAFAKFEDSNEIIKFSLNSLSMTLA